MPRFDGASRRAAAGAPAGRLAISPTSATVFHARAGALDGCTAHATENAALFVDDTAFPAALKLLDPG
jgi:hypothetical protein